MGLLPKAIVGFKRTHPKVSFQIQEGSYPDVLPAVRAGELDFALCLVPARPRDDELEFRILLRDRVTPAVRVGHPLASRGRLTVADLAKLDLDWVIYRRSHTGRDIFEQTFLAAGHAPPKSAIECTSFACTLALVEASDCVTLVPAQLFAERRRNPSITALAMDSAMPAWNVMVVSRAQHQLAPVCLAFLKYLHRIARPRSAGDPR
jgi:LysR family transcriptional regulator of gallate degradation